MSSSKTTSSTHYDTLGLKPECSPQDIRLAFLNLSKTHHPDFHPNEPTKHDKFVVIMEAYTVLSKPDLRTAYDSDLQFIEKHGFSSMNNQYGVQSNAPRYSAWRDESIWEMRDKEQDHLYRDRPYYGIKGLKKMSNLWIAGGAMLFMTVGALFHFVALSKSGTFTVTQLNRRDERLGKELSVAKQKARQNGNNLQLSILEAKLSDTDD